MPENTDNIRMRDLFVGKNNLFTGIGKTLTAMSLGLQGKDPTPIFDDIDDGTINLQQLKTRAELAELIRPGSGSQVIEAAIGMPISQDTAQISQSRSAITPSSVVRTGGTRKTLGGTETFKDLGAERELADIETEKQVASQAGKAAEESRRDFNRALGAFDTNINAMIDFGKRQMELFGTKPGDFLGLLDKAVPEQVNEFKAALIGSSVEGAALVATQIITSVRAAKITKIFEGSVGKIGSTLEGTINNIATSAQNAFSNAISQNVEIDGTPIQELIIDPKTGKPIKELGLSEQAAAINRAKKEFADNLRHQYLSRIIQKSPELLKKSTIKEFTENLKSFDSVEEAESANLLPGTMIVINGRRAVIE